MAAQFPFSHLPNEIKVKILLKLSRADMLNFRLVSGHCKDLVSAIFREFVCLVSDQTYSNLANCDQEVFRTIKISRLTQSNNRIISSTRGAGRLLRTAQCLQLYKTEIGEDILRKLVRHAINITELAFYKSACPVVNAVFNRGKNVYSNVTKLILTQIFGPRDDYMYPKEIGISANLSLPQLQHLSIHWTIGGYNENGDMLYFNLIYLIASVGARLKSLELLRDHNSTRLDLSDQLRTLDAAQFAEQEQFILTGLQRLKLQKLRISTSTCSEETEETRLASLYQFERALMGSAELQELCVENIIDSEDMEDGQPNFPTVANIFAVLHPVSLTRLVIWTSYFQDAREPFSLRIFRECSQLRELTVAFYFDETVLKEDMIHWLTDVEKLPRCLELLHLGSFRHNFDSERFPEFSACPGLILLSRAQLEWIAAGNLPGLRSFHFQFLFEKENLEIPEQVNKDLVLLEKLFRLPLSCCFNLQSLGDKETSDGFREFLRELKERLGPRASISQESMDD